MKIHLKNLGIFKEASFEVANLTIICGKNNTGKTYATYALYGFLSKWHTNSVVNLSPVLVHKLLKSGSIKLSLHSYYKRFNQYLEIMQKMYSKEIHKLYSANPNHFRNVTFSIDVKPIPISKLPLLKMQWGSKEDDLRLLLEKKKGSDKVSVNLLLNKDSDALSLNLLSEIIGGGLHQVLFREVLPNPFIVSAERTGIIMFQKDLDFPRHRLIESTKGISSRWDLHSLIDEAYSSYPSPIHDNIDFSRNIEDVIKQQSFISEKYPDIISSMEELAGGKYKMSKNKISFIPQQNKKIRLPMRESSSSVRSLLLMTNYLKHYAKENDILIIDEPELSLHPNAQRKFARLVVKLVNIGLKVFITTHSDYLIKELNTLIMLNSRKKNITKIRMNEGYQKSELLSPDNIKVYIAEKIFDKLKGNSYKSYFHTLREATINEYGIEVSSFDDDINQMNRIQNDIYFNINISNDKNKS